MQCEQNWLRFPRSIKIDSIKRIINSENSLQINLHNHDVWTAVTETVSFGFNSEHTPIKAGITIDGNAPNSPKLKIIKFFADVAKIYKEYEKRI